MSDQSFSALYSAWAERGQHLYPTEFVIRTLLGTYPGHRFEHDWAGQRILDVGFGDGRNFPLLDNMKTEIYGVEVEAEIVELARKRFPQIASNLAVGRNSAIPHDNDFFDAAIACHSCYYVDEGQHFDDNLAEIARVIKPGGFFVFSVPDTECYIFDGASLIGDHHLQIANDPFAQRQGQIMAAYPDKATLATVLERHFDDVRLGHQVDDYFGLRVSYFIAVCQVRPSVTG